MMEPGSVLDLPVGIDFDLVVTLRDQELAVRAFRLERDQPIDLGVIEIDVCH